MNARLLRSALMIGLLAAACARAEDEPREVKLAEFVMVMPSGDAELPFKFNYDCRFVISLNQSIPRFEAVKSNLVANLKAGKFAEDVVFNLFASEQPPPFIEVILGRRVPLGIARAVIKAVSEVPDLKVTLILAREDGRHGDTQRVYVGPLTQPARAPVTAEKLRALLDPRLSLEELHALMLKDA